MKKLPQMISWLALIGVIAPPIGYLGGFTSLDAVKTWMLVFTIVWFASVPLWMERRRG